MYIYKSVKCYWLMWGGNEGQDYVCKVRRKRAQKYVVMCGFHSSVCTGPLVFCPKNQHLVIPSDRKTAADLHGRVSQTWTYGGLQSTFR